MSKAGVKTCRIPGAILYHPELKLAEKVLLGLVWSFKDGLRLSNAELGRILCKHPVTVSNTISRLESAGWLKITAKRSRWRRIYFSADAKVKGDSTLAFDDSTLARGLTYFSPQAKQNRRNKKERDFSLAAVDSADATPEPTPAKEPPSPERMRAVLEGLGFIGKMR